MNAYYNWITDEIMVAAAMKDIQREAETIRRLREAGLSKPGLYERAASAFGSTLIKLGQRMQRKHLHSQVASGKYAV